MRLEGCTTRNKRGTMQRVRTSLIAVALLAAGLLAAEQQPAPQPPQGESAVAAGQAQGQGRGQRGRGAGRGAARTRKVVLAWADTRNGQAQHDSVSHALAVIERLGYESGTYDTYIRTDSHIIAKAPQKTTGEPASGGPNLNNVDAIFFMGHREVALDDKQKAELLSFVKDDGKGFVAAHVGLTALESWPEFGELLGARFDGHPIVGPGVVVNEDASFPVTRHFPARFDFNDEFYQPKDYSRDKLHVLLRLDLSNVPANPGLHRPDRDYPLAWAKMYGKGRVFYGSFAHSSATWDIRDVQQMYFEAIKWSLGLTDADLKPHPMPPAPGSEPAR
jgi:type 1 glutamine amidotransferase